MSKLRGIVYYRIKDNTGRIVDAFHLDTSIEDVEQVSLQHQTSLGLSDCLVEEIPPSELVAKYLESMGGTQLSIDLTVIDQSTLTDNTEWLSAIKLENSEASTFKERLSNLSARRTLLKAIAVLEAINLYNKRKVTLDSTEHNKYILYHLHFRAREVLAILDGIGEVMTRTAFVNEVDLFNLKRNLHETIVFACLILGELSKHGIHGEEEKALRVSLAHHITHD